MNLKLRRYIPFCSFLFLVSFFAEMAHAQSSALARLCDGARQDNNIWWGGVEHNSFEEVYRLPFGAVPTDAAPVRLRIKACANDLSSASLTYWDSRKSERKSIPMRPEFTQVEAELGQVQYWRADLPVSSEPNLLYYFFALNDGFDTDYYIDDDIRSFPGGLGKLSDDWNDRLSFQITVFDKNFVTPEWTKGAIVYQIFPDRFRNGDASNDPQTGKAWIYGLESKLNSWNTPLCDPLSNCPGQKYNQFYGGDLRGITHKLDDLKAMGVSALYLNPIFSSPTNHKYDTTDFMKIDPAFGTLQDFRDLATQAKAKGIHLILDGVLNHVSADSPYFDLWGRWNEKLEQTQGYGPGKNDASGACESDRSQWRSWFFVPDIGSPAVGTDRSTKVLCPNPTLAGSQGPFETYEAWFGFYNVPKINTRLKSVRDFFFQGGDNAVVPYWMEQGGTSWRLDVGGDIDQGWTQDPGNTYWEDFRKVVKTKNSDAWIIGEEWGNASRWLLGPEWDSVMNYRLRSALLNWMFDRCTGRGCSGGSFYENDSNENSSSGPIFEISDSQFVAQVQGVQESFPEEVWHSALNLLGSHDTNRILFLLKKISGEDSDLAKKKFLFLTGFLMAYPGAPSIYYGDEVGVDAPGKWIGGTWQDDPYNRVPFPWADQGMNPDTSLQASIRRLGQLRSSNSVLSKGGFEWKEVDEARRLLVFERRLGNDRVLVLLNRSDLDQDIEINGFISDSSVRQTEEMYPQAGRITRKEGDSFKVKALIPFEVRILKLK